MEANPHSILLVQSPPISAGCCAKRRSGDRRFPAAALNAPRKPPVIDSPFFLVDKQTRTTGSGRALGG